MKILIASVATTTIVATLATGAAAFSAGDVPSDASFALFDRFRADCPADPSCIYQFNADLITADASADGSDADTHDKAVWAAVFRSNNNNPSVFVRDEFLGAMNAATTASATSSSDEVQLPISTPDRMDDKLQNNLAREKPVAIARLRPSDDFDDTWVLDFIRCVLKKETMDESCDGGSEFMEAISVGVDALLLHHLQCTTVPFEGAIRTKSTLFSSKVLEERGFEPVEELAKDMATHVSAYEPCMAKYAQRSISTVSKSPGARDRALQIISLLGRMDPDKEEASSRDRSMVGSTDGVDDDEDNDPWAGIKQFI